MKTHIVLDTYSLNFDEINWIQQDSRWLFQSVSELLTWPCAISCLKHRKADGAVVWDWKILAFLVSQLSDNSSASVIPWWESCVWAVEHKFLSLFLSVGLTVMVTALHGRNGSNVCIVWLKFFSVSLTASGSLFANFFYLSHQYLPVVVIHSLENMKAKKGSKHEALL